MGGSRQRKATTESKKAHVIHQNHEPYQQISVFTSLNETPLGPKMAEISQQRMPIWAAETEVDEDLQDVDLSHAIGNYVQNDVYDEGECYLLA